MLVNPNVVFFRHIPLRSQFKSKDLLGHRFLELKHAARQHKSTNNTFQQTKT